MCQRCAGLIEAIDRYIEKADKKVTDQLKDQGFADSNATKKAMDGIEDGIAEALEEETGYITGEIEKSGSVAAAAQNLGAIEAGDKIAGAVAGTIKTQMNSVLPGLIDTYIKQTDRELGLLQVTERTTAWVDSWSQQLGQLMKTDSYKQIESILKDGLTSGKGVADITRDIQDSGIREERYRARRVALTETLRAHSVAQQEAYSQSPSVTGKMWCHTGEYRIEPRWNHMDMDGQIVGVNDCYILGGADGGTYEIMYPRDISLPPEESINCHCLSQPVVDEAILGMSLEERQAMQEEWFAKDQSDWEAELDEERKWRGVPEEDREEE